MVKHTQTICRQQFVVDNIISKILIPFRDINNQRTLQSDWPKTIWPITWDLDFSQIRDLRWVHYKPKSKKKIAQVFQEFQKHYFGQIWAHLAHFPTNQNFYEKSTLICFVKFWIGGIDENWLRTDGLSDRQA